MSRRAALLFLSFFCALLVGSGDLTPEWALRISRPKATEAGAASGATLPAPANASFDAPADSPDAAPPGWQLANGAAKRDKGSPSDNFALLHQGDATLISSPFTLGTSARSFSFLFKFFAFRSAGNSLKVSILSGPDFRDESEIVVKTCQCTTDWETQWVDVSRWAGQTIKVKFVRPAGSDGPVGIDDVAINLLEAKLGRNPSSAHVADPIDTSTGNFKLEEVDLPPILGKGVPLQFVRYYNAQSTDNGSLGYKWSHTYATSVNASNGAGCGVEYTAKVHYPDGRSDCFTISASGYVGPPGNHDSLTLYPLVPDNAYDWTLSTKAQVQFHKLSWWLDPTIADRNGNTTTFSNGTPITCLSGDPGGERFASDAGGRRLFLAECGVEGGVINLWRVRDELGREVRFAYSGGRLISVEGVDGVVTTYTYDSGNRMTSKSVNGVVQFQNVYDSANRVIQQTDANGGITCLYYGSSPITYGPNCSPVSPAPHAGQTVVVDPRGNKTTYSFDVDFRTYSVTNQLGGTASRTFDANWNVTCVTDPLGRKTGFSYDSKGNVTRVVDASNTDGNCGLRVGGVSWNYTYTSFNDVDLATDPQGRQTDYVYNATGNLTQVITPATRTCYTVDAAGLVTQVTESTTMSSCSGDVTNYGYNSYGNRTSISGAQPGQTFAYDIGSRLLSQTNALGHTTSLTYDARGNVLTVRDHLGNTTTNSYDAKGNLRTVQDATLKTTTYNYDALDRLTSVVDAANGTTSYLYDANGNLTRVTNARGKATNYAYDALNRLTSVTDPLGRTTSFQYDAASNLTQRTDARGLVTKYFYDALDRNTRSEHWNGGAMVDAVTYAYDAVGNRIQMTDPTGTTTYVPDGLNRLANVTFPGNKTVSYQYDTLGNRTRVTYPDGKYVNYGFDAAHNLTSLSDWGGRTSSFAYNAAAALTTVTYPSATGLTSTRAYDGADRLTSVTNKQGANTLSFFNYTMNAAGNRTQVVDNAGTTAFGYDNLHRLTSAAYPGGPSDTYTYDAVGNRTTKNGSAYAYDNADQMLTSPGGPGGGFEEIVAGGTTSAKGEGQTLSFQHTVSGTNRLLVVGVSVRSGPVTGVTYNGVAMTQAVSAGNGEPPGWKLEASLWYLVGPAVGTHEVRITNTGTGGVVAGALSLNGVDQSSPIRGVASEQGWTTNPSLSVTSASGDLVVDVVTGPDAGAGFATPDATQTQLWNLLQIPGDTRGAGSRKSGASSVSMDWSTQSEYWGHAAASIRPAPAPSGVSYSYDANGNQTSRSSDAFAWDHEDRLTSATVAGVQTTNTYNGDGLRMSRTSGGQTASYVWDVGAGLPLILQETAAGATTTYVYGPAGLLYWVDSAGNPTYRLTDGLGSTVALCDAAGNVTATWTYDAFGAVRSHTGGSTEFTFTGEQNDPNGLEYLRARYYDPTVGRFLGRDPLGGGYPYAGNNPANLTDPSGLYAICGDDPTWGYICFDSTQVGLGACDGNGHCYVWTPDVQYELVDRLDDACVFTDGSLHHCYGLDDSRFTEQELEFAASATTRIENARKRLLESGIARESVRLYVAIGTALACEAEVAPYVAEGIITLGAASALCTGAGVVVYFFGPSLFHRLF